MHMNTELPRVKEKPSTEALVIESKDERYPVQQVATDGEVTKQEVRDAVCEINPDKESLDSRG